MNYPAGADVLLDGDSAFAASAALDLRALPEHARTLVKIIAEGSDLVINQSDEVLDSMEDWLRKAFAENGFLNFLANETVKQASPLAGCSIHLDRRFISKYMPRLDIHLH
ncbi:hypothetical protein KIN20_031842 [Parelaphostrongylus tenuis]|uniref:Uncharacterized protein n=1 Tax=Parelaphostrongylus tenuis TaxID=148309 RepID=A0AAD5R629_PARTN|nr:hypothetical protein KIN20_031842 [Parelaphostrongylus tenuis]